MLKKILIGFIIAAVILLGGAGFIYAYQKEKGVDENLGKATVEECQYANSCQNMEMQSNCISNDGNGFYGGPDEKRYYKNNRNQYKEENCEDPCLENEYNYRHNYRNQYNKENCEEHCLQSEYNNRNQNREKVNNTNSSGRLKPRRGN